MPIYEALLRYRKNRIVSFDVPGHKQGRGSKILTDFLGMDCMSVDVNSMKPLDNLIHPVSVIKEAEALAAEAFGCKHAFFMVNGTSSAVQAMIMATVKKDEKIIMPRNVHRSAINALVVCGAKPIYVNPGLHKEYGISLGMNIEDLKKTIKENPDAKAILVNNPTYYGICSDLKQIVKIAHEANMKVLVDEAHGTHFYFGDDLPISAMKANADMAAVSTHKTGGSLTQSSLLLINNDINEGYVRQIINLTSTTSASYLLLSSLDITRSNLALNGKKIYETVLEYVRYAREEINKIGGYEAYTTDIVNGTDVYAFDETKLTIHTRNMGLAGIEVYDILRDEYDIQIELGDIGNILAIISVGDRISDIERLIAALVDIKRRYGKDKTGLFDHEYIDPIVKKTPQEAFYAKKRQVKIEEAEGKIVTEFVMCYPPGIPILAPGELVTKDIIAYIKYAKAKGCMITGPEDINNELLNVMEE